MIVRDILLVATGGAAGALARFGANSLCTELLGNRFPWGTLIVNVIGCFALGCLVHLESDLLSPASRLALGTGFLGAFTTFSTFGVETIISWNRAPLMGMLNVAGNVVFGLLAVLLGIYASTRVFDHWSSS